MHTYCSEPYISQMYLAFTLILPCIICHTSPHPSLVKLFPINFFYIWNKTPLQEALSKKIVIKKKHYSYTFFIFVVAGVICLFFP